MHCWPPQRHTRGAKILEASLILHFECTAVNYTHNYNWKTGSAYDYEERNFEREADEHYVYYVYIAVKPLPPCRKCAAAAASARPPLEPTGDMTRNSEGTLSAEDFAKMAAWD